MGNRQQIQEIPGALRMTLEKARAEYGAVVRKVRWGDGPIYVCGAGDCAALGLAAGYALEYFLGWPVVARPVEVFQSYGRSLLQPRSVLVMISAKGEWPEAQELARVAQERGCTLVALTNTPDSPLVKLADHVFLTPAEGDAESPAVTVCMHAALNFLAFEAMRVLKKPKPRWDLVEKEFDQLPEKLDWVFTQLPSVVRSVAAEVARLSQAAHRGWRFLPLSRLAGGAANEIPGQPSGRGRGSHGISGADSPTSPGVTTRFCFFPARNRKSRNSSIAAPRKRGRMARGCFP